MKGKVCGDFLKADKRSLHNRHFRMKKKTRKISSVVMALVIAFLMNVYAAEPDTTIEQTDTSRAGSKVISKQITTYINRDGYAPRELTFYAECSYVVNSDYNDVHYFEAADFFTSDVYVDGVSYYLSPYDRSWMESSSAYQLYELSDKTAYPPIHVRLQVYCDEWGEVYLSATII